MPRSRKMSASYEDQQAELQKMADGETESRPAPHKEPEVNPEVYKDVEPFIFQGFITQHALINDTEFVFKSLNQHEHEMIRMLGGYDEKGNPTKRFWSLFIAYSVLMLDGINILPERARWLPKFAKEFEDFQVTVRTKIVRNLSELNRRARRAVTLTECYSLEKYSRYRWFQLHGVDLTSPSVTGFDGTQHLGMNWAQLTWRALNRIDDLKDSLEQQWEHAKFVGSCSAGKGIQKVYQQDAERRRTERDDQLSRKDAVLRHVLLGEPIHDKVRHKAGAVWVTAQSVEDLAAQLQNDLKGEKDWHDAVVDKYEGRMRSAQESKDEQVKELYRQREVEFEGKSLVGGTDMTGFTPAEVRDRMLRQRQIAGQLGAGSPAPVRQAPQEVESSVGTTTDSSNATPLPVTRPAGQPFRRG